MSAPLPREHGAWGILAVPFVTAAAIAGSFSLAVVLAFAVVLLVFLARGPLEAALLTDEARKPLRLALAYGLPATVLGLGLLLVWKLYLLLPLGGLAVLIFMLHLWAVRARKAHYAAAQLLGTTALTLSAPVAWIAATGGLDSTGALVWLLNWIFFCCGVLYVRERIRLQQAARRGATVPAGWWASLVNILALGVVAALVWAGQTSIWIVVPFGLAAARAAWGLRAAGQPLALRRLGWSEVLLSLFFASFLTLGFRF